MDLSVDVFVFCS